MTVIFLILLMQCYLPPVEPRRFSYSLNGIWKFKTSSSSSSFEEEMRQKDFYLSQWIEMPVPSSFNDITTNATIRDYVGRVWYWRDFQVLPEFARGQRYFVKFGKVHYESHVWINGKKVGNHDGGHLPFEFEITSAVETSSKYDIYGRILIGVDNTLSEYTLPQGRFIAQNDSSRYPPGFKTYTHDFDYFDYSGINGNVDLIMKPKNYIKDVTITTRYRRNQGAAIAYKIEVETSETGIICHAVFIDPFGSIVLHVTGSCQSDFTWKSPFLWWPAHTFPNKTPGLLYTIVVDLIIENEIEDSYSTKFGIRQVELTRSTLLINGEPVYLKGFGMHEDSETRGRGFDWVSLSRDMSLLDWTQANVIRTSHYPYSEEFIGMADERGLLVIMETPACSLNVFDERMLQVHKSVAGEMWKAFKNHPSIIMWSLANEPVTSNNSSDEYFRDLSDFLRGLDATRPITFVTSQQIMNEKAAQHMDVICVNRYNAWYQDSGRLDVINYSLTHEITQWARQFRVPVIVTEYGAGAIAGLHDLPSAMWSEDYQTDLFGQHFIAFDNLRARNLLAGELIWNFADFKTPQEYIRPGVCAKGVFTRNRQPKAVARSVRERFKRIQESANDIMSNETIYVVA